MRPVFAKLQALEIPPERSTERDPESTATESELITRVIRRAAELRSAWAEEGEGAEPPVIAQRGWRKARKADSPQAVPADGSARPEPGKPKAKTAKAVAKPPSGPPEEVAPAKQAARSELTPADRSTPPAEWMSLLEQQGLEIIDKRPMGGSLWVIGGKELSALMVQLRGHGTIFTFAANGGRATNHRPAWFRK